MGTQFLAPKASPTALRLARVLLVLHCAGRRGAEAQSMTSGSGLSIPGSLDPGATPTAAIPRRPR